MEQSPTLRAAVAILHYLQDHPEAADTVAGIAKWWVGEEIEVVQKALELLVKESVVVREEDRYRLAPTKAPERTIAKTVRKLRKR